MKHFKLFESYMNEAVDWTKAARELVEITAEYTHGEDMTPEMNQAQAVDDENTFNFLLSDMRQLVDQHDEATDADKKNFDKDIKSFLKKYRIHESAVNEASFSAEGASGTISIKARIDELSDILSARKPKDEERAAIFTDAMETLGQIVDWNCNKVSFNIQFEYGEMTFDFSKSMVKITRD